jgi:nucleotide-binding universal stress UspA family protein
MSAVVHNSTTPMPAEELPRGRTVALHRDVLLATDGSPAAFAATRFVGALATQWPVTPHVITVVPPPPMAFDPLGGTVALDISLEEQLGCEVGGQLETCFGSTWSRETRAGSPAVEIVRAAERRGSELIIVGLRPHAFLDRVFRDETALSVMRHARVPVLAVTPLLQRLPRRIAVAIDFSRASIAAARSALALLDDGGSLALVYVEPPTEPHSDETEGFGTIYAQGVAAAFSRLRQELASRPNVSIETVVLHGNVAAELLSFAERADVDLIAVGSQRHSTARRAFVGGVTTALARAATRSLLVLPPGRRV